MPDFSKRSEAIEIMDDLNCSGNVVDQTLVELEFINKWLGGNAVTLNGLHSILRSNLHEKNNDLRIADLGCGSGDMLKILSGALKKKNVKASFIGIDANPNIIDFAKKSSTLFSEIQYEALNILSSDFKSREFDIVFATLFFHHFTARQLIEIFSLLKQQSKIGIVINDLHRHWLAFYSIKVLTKFFSKSSMVRNDAPLSVLRGFKRKELLQILEQAGIEDFSLHWKWAFRWQLVIRC